MIPIDLPFRTLDCLRRHLLPLPFVLGKPFRVICVETVEVLRVAERIIDHVLSPPAQLLAKRSFNLCMFGLANQIVDLARIVLKIVKVGLRD